MVNGGATLALDHVASGVRRLDDEQLAVKLSETVILSVRSGDFRVHIDFVEGLHSMRRIADLGVQAPLYAGATSKVLLAGMEDDEIEAYVGRTDLTALKESTITDRNVLWREIRSIHKRAFAESKGELFAGGGALAAPIKIFPDGPSR